MKKSKNTLLRYKLIQDLYVKHKTEDIPVVVVYRKYIYPTYPISLSTFYLILGTPVNKLLKEFDNENKTNNGKKTNRKGIGN